MNLLQLNFFYKPAENNTRLNKFKFKLSLYNQNNKEIFKEFDIYHEEKSD